jgi:hypothetical protein
VGRAGLEPATLCLKGIGNAFQHTHYLQYVYFFGKFAGQPSTIRTSYTSYSS